jgi:lysophospholipase L1-like esterase
VVRSDSPSPMRSGPSKFVGAVIATLAALASIAATELALRSFLPITDPYDRYKRRQVETPIPSQFPRHFRFTTEPEPGLRGISGKNRFTINNAGFRGDPLPSPKPPREYRIFLVGGSTMEAFYLDDSAAPHSVLQRELNRSAALQADFKVYNAGKSGDASDDHLAMISQRIVHLEPDMLIVLAGVNDLSRSLMPADHLHFSDTPDSFRSRLSLFRLLAMAATEFQLGRRAYYTRHRLAPGSEQDVFENIPARSDYRYKAKVAQAAPVSGRTPPLNPGPYRTNLASIIGLSKIHRFQLILATQPSTWNSQIDPEVRRWHWMVYRYGTRYKEELLDAALELFNDVARALSDQHSVPLCDLPRLMPKSGEFFYDDVHFTDAGALRFGQSLARFILDRALTRAAEARGTPQGQP